jgi:hypothetical protein
MMDLFHCIEGYEIDIAWRLTLISTLFCCYHFYQKVQNPSSQRHDSLLAYPCFNRKIITLHQYEAQLTFFEGTVSTITWFEGNAAQAASLIRDRVKEIIRLNPWLAGTLAQESELSIIFDDIDTVDNSTLDRLFSFHNNLRDGETFYLGKPLPDLAETALNKHRI